MNHGSQQRIYKAFLRFENVCVSDAIRNDPDEMDRARLFLRTCIIAGTAAYALLAIGQLLTPSMWRSYLIITVGQTVAIASAGLLKFAKHTTWPIRIFAVIGVLHLIISCGVSGGLQSPLLFAFSIMPIFVGFLGGKRLAIHTTLGLLAGGLLLLFWDMHEAFELPYVFSKKLNLFVLAWALATLATVFIYAQIVYTDLVKQLEGERQRLQDVNASKDLFLAYMSHEIRNPLTAIVGATELLTLDPQASKNKYLKSLREATANLNHLVTRVLDFSRLETDKIELERKPIAIRELCETIQGQHLPGAHSKGLALDYHIHPSTVEAVIGDPAKLRQVLTNLLNNATKFTDEGSIRLALEPIDDGQRTRISVSDTGIGIAADELSAVFEPYHQARGARHRISGTGLGLAICSALVQQMGSKLELESTEGVGSKFSFSLETTTLPDSAHETNSTREDPLELLLHGLTGLVVDDNRSAATVLQGMLQSLGCTAAVVNSGTLALDYLKDAPTDFVLMDMQMPGMDGATAATEIRNREKETGRPPTAIVMVTGNFAPQMANSSNIFNAVVSKPVSRQDLVHAIMTTLDELRN
jgi:signal transduction histidine kinase/CheY-like chemotaxis protein